MNYRYNIYVSIINDKNKKKLLHTIGTYLRPTWSTSTNSYLCFNSECCHHDIHSSIQWWIFDSHCDLWFWLLLWFCKLYCTVTLWYKVVLLLCYVGLMVYGAAVSLVCWSAAEFVILFCALLWKVLCRCRIGLLKSVIEISGFFILLIMSEKHLQTGELWYLIMYRIV